MFVKLADHVINVDRIDYAHLGDRGIATLKVGGEQLTFAGVEATRLIGLLFGGTLSGDRDQDAGGLLNVVDLGVDEVYMEDPGDPDEADPREHTEKRDLRYCRE